MTSGRIHCIFHNLTLSEIQDLSSVFYLLISRFLFFKNSVRRNRMDKKGWKGLMGRSDRNGRVG